MPVKRDSLQAFREKDWSFEQVSRLEVRRDQEHEIRQTWFKKQAAKWRVKEEQMLAEEEESGSRWRSHDDASRGADWWTQGEARSSGCDAETAARAMPAEPTAAGASSSSDVHMHRTPEEDKATLRDAILTPASFMPQRWVTYALGRPVVVLRGYANPFSVYR